MPPRACGILGRGGQPSIAPVPEPSARVCHPAGEPHPNYAFVTSQRVPTRFQPLEVADSRCNDAAAAAGLPGEYRAWLSTAAHYARDRLAGARGWIRTDGAPFADTVDDL